ncbi:MAG: hypothetical protein ABSH08_20850, partial [Tepidisphaeraceae bacterium]
KTGERWVEGLEFVQKLSAGTLVIASGIVTGGAAWGVELSGAAASGGMLTIGASLKGVHKYYEKHNIGAAVLETSTEIVTGLIPLGPASKVAKEFGNGAAVAVKILGASIGAVMDVGKTIVEGESMKEAVASAAAKMAVKIVFPSDQLAKCAIPIVAKIAPGLAHGAHTIAEFASEFAKDSTVNYTGTRASRAFEVEVHEPFHPVHSKHSSNSARPLAISDAANPHLTDIVLALTSGQGTPVDYVKTTAMRSLQPSMRQPLMSIGSGAPH